MVPDDEGRRLPSAAINRPTPKSPPAGFPNSLLQVESELRRTLDEAGVGTWSWDLVTERISLSHTCAELMGATTLDVRIQMFCKALSIPKIAKEGRRRSGHAIECGAGLRHSYSSQDRMVRFLGCARAAAWKATPVDARLSSEAWFSASIAERVEDELRAREEHLRSILDTVPEGMIVIDGMASWYPSVPRPSGCLIMCRRR